MRPWHACVHAAAMRSPAAPACMPACVQMQYHIVERSSLAYVIATAGKTPLSRFNYEFLRPLLKWVPRLLSCCPPGAWPCPKQPHSACMKAAACGCCGCSMLHAL